MTHAFDRAISLEEAGRTETTMRFNASLDRAFWVADSGPWGGYICALMANALSEIVELPVVSLTTHFLGRLREGDASVIVEVEAAGSRVGHASVRVVQGDRTGALALATLGSNPQDDFVSDHVRPEVPPPDSVKRRAESTHAYMQHFDVRPTTLVRPWSGENEGTLQGWVNLVDRRPLDLPLLVALPDVWMPGTWARLTTPAGKVTVEMSVYARSEISVDDIGWWFVRVRTEHIERGFNDERCEIWGGDGRLLAQARQLVMLARR